MRRAVDGNEAFFHKRLNAIAADFRKLRDEKPVKALAGIFGRHEKFGTAGIWIHWRKLSHNIAGNSRRDQICAGCATRYARAHNQLPAMNMQTLTICIRETAL